MPLGSRLLRLLISMRWALSRLLGQRFERCLQRMILTPLRQALGVHAGRPGGSAFAQSKVDFAPLKTVFMRTPMGLPDQRRYTGMLEHQLALAAKYARRPSRHLVSVIMPSHNRAHVMRDAIDSVIAQAYPNWELLVVDDGSEDDTRAVVESYRDARVQYLHTAARGGSAKARNVGLEAARGTYIAYLDTDNSWDPLFLLIMINALLDQPAFTSAYCGQRIIDRDANSQNPKLSSIRFAYYHHALVRNQNYLDVNVFVHHRQLYENDGGFDDSLQRLADWDLVLRYTDIHIPLAVPCILNDYFRIAGTIRNTERFSFWESVDHIQQKQSRKRITLARSPVSVKPDTLYSMPTQPRPAQPGKVTVVIPSYNAIDSLCACIETLRKFTDDALLHIVIVDNASNGEVVTFLRDLQEDGIATVLFNERNMGFSYAINQGIAAADVEHDLVLLNNDAIVTEGWLEALSEVKQDIPAAGIIAPQQVLPPFTKTMAKHIPRCLEFRELDVTVSHHHNNLIDILLMPEKGFMELDFVNFFCVYITRTCLDAVGMLDHENGRHYLSDRLFCEAVRKHDAFKIVYTPHAKIYHLLQQSTSELKSGNRKEFETMFVKNEWDEQSRSAMQGDPRAKRKKTG